MNDEEREDLNTFRHELVKQARWWKWKAEALEKEKAKLESENAELQARIDKSVELKDPYYVVDNDSGMIRLYYENVVRYGELYEDLEEAESRLAELKGKK